jgi:hypothetical protein
LERLGEHDVPDLEPADLARMLKDASGIAAHGNERSEWEASCRFDYANPRLPLTHFRRLSPDA